MDVILSRIALEELTFLGWSGCSVNELFAKVISRLLSGQYRHFATLLNNATYKEKVIKIIASHKHVMAKDQFNGDVLSIRYATDYLSNNNLQLLANDYIKNHILDLNIFSNISEVEGRLAIYMAIASKGFDGCWQYEISRMLKMDPKMVFQHLKYLYKYDCIVRFSIPMPTNHKKRFFPNEDSNLSSGGHLSAIIWLSRFFDINLIPRELSQLIWYQHIQPLSTEILKILEFKAPGKIAWEKDIRALCAGFLIVHDENSADHLICSQRTANKVFNKLRDFLITKNVRRVFAWNPITKSYSPCLCLKDAFPSTTVELSSDVTVKTETYVSELNINSEGSIHQRDDLNNEGQVNANTNSGLIHDFSLEEIHFSTDNKIFEMTEVAQIIWLIRASGRAGLVSLDIVNIIGINMKRLGKLLSDLCKSKIINKIPQRYNRTFMYRYYFNNINCLNLDTNTKAKLAKESDNSDKVKINLELETKHIMTVFAKTFPNRKVELTGLTEQFIKRLISMKNWLDESKILTIPEISKLFSETENTQNGPDRKTIKRILTKLLELDEYSKESSIASNKSTNTTPSSEITIFFSSKFYTENEARNLKAIELKNKRSSTTKSAIERRKKELSQVAAIIDASSSLSPSKENEDSVSPHLNNNFDSVLNQIDKKDVHNFIQTNTPRLITNKIGDATVMLNTPDFMVASLDIEIDGNKNSITDPSNTKRNNNISKLDVPGTDFIKKMNFDPSKRISLGFSNLSKGGIKIRSCNEKIGFLSFSQKILAHYGFVFPIMIRLKILHHHMIFLCPENKLKCGFLSTKEILDNMNLDTFLRVIGFGHRSKFIEEYLLNGDSKTFEFGPNTCIKELPSNLYEKLTRNYSKKNLFGLGKKKHFKDYYDKGRKAITVLYKLLLLLCKLKFIHFSVNEDKLDDNSDLTTLNVDQINIETVPLTSPSWKLEYNLKIPILIDAMQYDIKRLTEYIKHSNSIFSIKTNEQFEQFWAILNKESIDTNDFILEFKPENYNAIFPDILLKRNWKVNQLLSLSERNQLEKYARQLLFQNIDSSDSISEPKNKSHIVLSLASPEINNISNELSINPLTTLKYLIRVVDSLSLEEFNFSNNPDLANKISFHPIRDPRYQCHICKALYSTHPAIISHYRATHNISSITNSSMYTIKKDSSLSPKNKSISLNSTIRTQMLSENYIPSTLKHLLELKEADNICNEIERADKIELLRAFLRLSKEDITLLYIMLFISNKVDSNYKKIIPNSYLFRIILFCKEKIESNLFSLQFLRIKSLIQDMSLNSKYNLIGIIEFIFSCLKLIYPLNSKLLDAIKLKERQRVCWSHLLEINLFSKRWKTFATQCTNSSIYVNNNSTLNNLSNDEFFKNYINFEGNDVKNKSISKIDYLMIINFIKSELIGQKKILQDEPIFKIANQNLLNDERIKNYFENSINKNLLKQINRNSNLSKFEESVDISKRFALTRRTILNCFGKTIVWREIFELCFAFVQINYSNSIKFDVSAQNSSGAFVLSHLNNLIENNCILEIEWSDQDFYEKASNKTDEELFRLLNEVANQNSSEDLSVESSSFSEKSIFSSKLVENKTSPTFSEVNKTNLNEVNGRGGLELLEAGIKESPTVLSIKAVYLNKQNNNNRFHNFKETKFSSINIPFLGTADSDPIEMNRIPSDFSISAILSRLPDTELRCLNRQTVDPIFTIIKEISDFIIKSDTCEHKIIMRAISIIIFNLENNSWLTISEIEEIFFSKFPNLISELTVIGSRFIDPGIFFYELRLPIIYHLIFLLEILKICIRIPTETNWLFSIFCSLNNKIIECNTDNQYNNNNIKINNSDINPLVPINMPTRIWLLWSNEVTLQLFNKRVISLVINNINKSLSEIFKNKDFNIPHEIYLNKAPINCFINVDGQINLPVCGLLIYFISSLTQKSPILNLTEFTTRFSFFSSCEIELILESMFAENCLYKDDAKIIFSKPIQEIFKVYEGYL